MRFTLSQINSAGMLGGNLPVLIRTVQTSTVHTLSHAAEDGEAHLVVVVGDYSDSADGASRCGDHFQRCRHSCDDPMIPLMSFRVVLFFFFGAQDTYMYAREKSTNRATNIRSERNQTGWRYTRCRGRDHHVIKSGKSDAKFTNEYFLPD